MWKKRKKNAEEDPQRDHMSGNDHAQIDNLSSLFSALINYGFVLGVSLLLYWAIAYPIQRNTPAYVDRDEFVVSFRAEHRLGKQESDMTHDEMEEINAEFFLVSFPEEMKKYYNDFYDKDYTIEHVYNILMLDLPEEPSAIEYSNQFYSYNLGENGEILVDVVGYRSAETSRNMHSFLYNAYTFLENYARAVVPGYDEAVSYTLIYDGIARSIPYGIALLIHFLLMPLFFKNSASLGEKLMKLGYYNKRSGYRASYWKQIPKMVLLGSFGTVGVFLAYPHFFIIFTVFPYFLDLVYRLFSFNRVSIVDRFLFLRLADLRYEKIYENEADWLQDGERSLGAFVDPGYTATLSGVETISLKDRGDGAH